MIKTDDVTESLLKTIEEDSTECVIDLMVYGICIRDSNGKRIDPMDFFEFKEKDEEE